MKSLFAVSVVFAAACLSLSPAMAGGPVMPCETGGTLHLTKKHGSECSSTDCKKLVAVATQEKDRAGTR